MKRLLVLVLSLILIGAACSSTTSSDAVVTDTADAPDDDGAPTNGDGADGADPPAGDSNDNEPAQSEPTDDGGDGEGDGGDGGTGGESEPPAAGDASGTAGNTTVDLLQTSDWCTAARSIETSFDELEAPDLSNTEFVEVAYTTAVALVRQSIEIAPPEIVADVVITADALDLLVAALADAEWSFLDMDLAVLENIDQEMEVATFNIDRYNFEVCGIDNGFDPADDPALRPDDGGSGTDVFPSDGTLRDQTIDSLVQVGFTAEEAACLIERVDVAELADVFSNQESLLALLTECGIPLERLAQLGG